MPTREADKPAAASRQAASCCPSWWLRVCLSLAFNPDISPSAAMRTFGSRSVTGALAAVDMQDLARHEAGLFEIEDGVSDVRHLAHVADRMQDSERGVGLGGVHRRLDDAGRDRVHADALLGVF